jgi:hypothetical protein
MDPTDIDALRERYRSLGDDELVRMAFTAAADLTPMAKQLFKAELMARQLVPALWPTVDVHVDAMSREQIDAVVRRVQFMPCPRCGESATSLNAFVTRHGPYIPLPGVILTGGGFYLGCQPCLAKVGAWRLFRLKPGQRWRPSERLTEWVIQHAALFIHFESNVAALAALLRFDYAGFLEAIDPNPRGRPG